MDKEVYVIPLNRFEEVILLKDEGVWKIPSSRKSEIVKTLSNTLALVAVDITSRGKYLIAHGCEFFADVERSAEGVAVLDQERFERSIKNQGYYGAFDESTIEILSDYWGIKS